MGKPVNQRTYAKSLASSRQNMSSEEIRNSKCAKRRRQHEHNKQLNRFMMEDQVFAKKQPGYADKQLEKLDFRLGVGVGVKAEREQMYEMIGRQR